MHPKRTNLSRRTVLKITSLLGAQSVLAYPAFAAPKTDDDMTSAQSQLSSAQARLGSIADEYEELSRRQSDTLDELDKVEVAIRTTSRNIAKIKERCGAKRGELSRNVADEYKDGSHGIVDLILGSKSIDDLISGLYYYDKVSKEQARLIGDVKDEEARLENERVQLTQKRKALQEVSRIQSEQLDEMRDKQYDAQKLVDGLNDEVRGLLYERESDLRGAQQEAAKAREDREQASTKSGYVQATTHANAPNILEISSAMAMEFDEEETAQSLDQMMPVADVDAEPYDEVEEDMSAEGYDEQHIVQEELAEEPSAGVGSVAAVIAACNSTPSPGAGLCAAWCSNVLVNAGLGFVSGNANDMYAEYCHSANRDELQPGMAVAVSSHPHTSAGRIYGHIGMYVGDGTVMDNIGYIRSISLDEWTDYYGETVPVRWGWLGGIVLA